MKKLFLTLFAFACLNASAQVFPGFKLTYGSTAPTNPCHSISTLFVENSSAPNPGKTFSCPSVGANWVDIGLGSGLSNALTSAHIFLGNGSNIATDTAVSGDISILNTGATTVNSIGGKTVSLSGNLTTTGAFNPTFAIGSSSTWTFPSGGGTLLISGGALGTPSSGTLTNATGLPIAGITGLGTGVATALGLAVSGSGAICLATGSACTGGGGSVTWQVAGSTVVTGATVNFATGFLGTNVAGVFTVNPDLGLLLSNGNDQKNVCKFVDSTTGNSSYSGSLASGCTALTTGNLVAGSTFLLRTNFTCSTSCTLQIDSVPAVAAAIKLADGTTNPGGAIVSGQFNWVMYDGSVFRLLPGGTGGTTITLQTNAVNNTSQTTLNFQTSTTNSVGLTITPSNPSGGNEKMEITGTYTGTGVYNTVQTTGPGGQQPTPTSQTSQVKANFTFPLKAANNSGNSSTDISVVGPCDPRKMVCFFDDFVITGTSGPSLFSNGNYIFEQFNTATLAVDSPSATGTYGSFTMATGANSQAVGSLIPFSNAPLGNYAGTTFDYLVRFKLSATAQARMFLGFKDAGSFFFTNAGTQNGIVIAFDASVPDTNFMCVALSGGVSTRTSTGVAADTSLHTARIRSTTAGTVLCSIDGGSEASVSTNVPTAALQPFFEIDTTTSPADTHLTLDYWWHEFDITR